MEEMKGLIFSEPMVKAWMEGRKTVTRRLMNPQPPKDMRISSYMVDFQFFFCNKEHPFHREIKPHYRPGEMVYIKETWATPVDDPNTKEIGLISYPASELLLKGHWKIKSPRFMPEWAARSHALIKSVRPEQLKDMTPDEFILEGFQSSDEFIDFWTKLHGVWTPRIWVWRIELEKK